MIKERITNNIKEKNMKQDFGKAIERLLDGIRTDYAKWSSPESVDNDSMKIGNAMREIGYGDSDVDEYREELRDENPNDLYGNN